MRISLHQLNVFKAIAEQGGVTAASKAMHMTQPAVSNLLKQLEQYFDCNLVEMIGKKMHLTLSGEALLKTATQVIGLIDECQSNISLINGGLKGTLKVSVVSTAKYFMPRLLSAFHESYPDVEVVLNVCNREQVIERLWANQDDFVIMSQPPSDSRCEIVPFFDDQLVVISGTKPDSKSCLALNELENENWIVREVGSGTRMVMERLFTRHEMQPNIKMSLGNNESIKQFVMAGMGISIVSRQSIEIEAEMGLLFEMPVKQFPIAHEWYKVTNKGKAQSALVELFQTFITSHRDLTHYAAWLK